MKRIQGRAGQRIRARVLRANPLCVRCLEQDVVREAVQVDHVIALTNGGEENKHDDANRQGLCAAHHAEKTRMDLGQKPKPWIGIDGYPRD